MPSLASTISLLCLAAVSPVLSAPHSWLSSVSPTLGAFQGNSTYGGLPSSLSVLRGSPTSQLDHHRLLPRILTTVTEIVTVTPTPTSPPTTSSTSSPPPTTAVSVSTSLVVSTVTVEPQSSSPPDLGPGSEPAQLHYGKCRGCNGVECRWWWGDERADWYGRGCNDPTYPCMDFDGGEITELDLDCMHMESKDWVGDHPKAINADCPERWNPWRHNADDMPVTASLPRPVLPAPTGDLHDQKDPPPRDG
ncbi:MAG: hypothetical protein Q9183_004799 [Haloplaca sp. 2 TL-2023]